MTPRDNDRPTCPPGPADADADAFAAHAREHGEWAARLEHLTRLHEGEDGAE